jgi:uncharacterized protein
MNTKLAVALSPSDTPCVRNCCLDDNKICLGCGRSLPEILEWHHADDARQDKIRSNAQIRLIQPA